MFTDSLIFFPPCDVSELFYKYVLPLVAKHLEGLDETKLECLQVIVFSGNSHNYEITLTKQSTLLKLIRKGIVLLSRIIPEGWECEKIQLRGFTSHVVMEEGVIQMSKKRAVSLNTESARHMIQNFIPDGKLVEDYF